jgi:hypothetical protein
VWYVFVALYWFVDDCLEHVMVWVDPILLLFIIASSQYW